MTSKMTLPNDTPLLFTIFFRVSKEEEQRKLRIDGRWREYLSYDDEHKAYADYEWCRRFNGAQYKDYLLVVKPRPAGIPLLDDPVPY